MEWLNSLQNAIEYIEENIANDIEIEGIAKHVGISPFYLQRSFQIVSGYSLGEYIRNRKLYLAAAELSRSNNKVIDIAYKYGYETPEAFSKAFTRFHEVTPIQVKNGKAYKPFHKLKFKIEIEQGEEMEVKITPMFPIKLIGFESEFSFETSYQEIPKYWDEICEKYCKRIYAGLDAVTPEEKAIVDNCIGEYAVCMDGDSKTKTFKYMIAGRYTGGEIPNGMKLVEFERGDWAVFDCYGPNPKTLQETNTKIFNEWIPNNKEYDVRENYNIEWYDCTSDMNDAKYHSAIWIPVKKK